MPPPHLTLDNFTIPNEVPENCPFVLTSPRSLQACQLAGIKPVDLLPSTLAEYEAALPDLPRERVLAIFREVETAKEGRLGLARELRRQLVAGEQAELVGVGEGRKLSCLSPIVEHVGSREDSAVGTSLESPFSESRTERAASLPSTTRGEEREREEEEEVVYNDQPESDQHFNLPRIQVNGTPDSLLDLSRLSQRGSPGYSVTPSQGGSLASDLFHSDLEFSCSPSPVALLSSCLGDSWRSCPELGLSRAASHSRCRSEELGSPRGSSAGRGMSQSAAGLQMGEDNLGSPVREGTRTPTHAKRKASRKERLTSESLQSLYDVENGEKPEADRQIHRARVEKNKKAEPVSPGSSNMVRSALSRSEIDIDRLQISQQDLRILEILALRNNAEWERRQEQHRLRVQWEDEKRDREARREEIEKESRRQLTVKRRKETEDCQRRLLHARERFLKSQEHLRQLLKEKDDRKKELLQSIVRQKELLVLRHRENEERRRGAVEQAVTDLLTRDTQYREELRTQVEKKLALAETRRRQHELSRTLSLSEANRRDTDQHKQRVKKLEEIYEDHVQKIKRAIERKLKQAKELGRDMEGGSRHTSTSVRVQQLKSELEAGLDLWRKQVLSVQSLSIMKAEERARRELESRRERLAEEMRSREERCQEKRREQQKETREKVATARKKLERKEKKIAALLVEREQSIMRARKMAETSAKLREIIKAQY